LEILNGLIQFTLFLMGKFNSKVEPPLGTDCVRLSRVHCNWINSCQRASMLKNWFISVL